jgi:hypothetical protein
MSEEPYLLSRIRSFALVAILAALATALAACGGGSESAKSVIENATLKGVTSGTIDAKIGIKSTGEKSGDLEVTLSGPFQGGGGKGSLPQFALTAEAKGTLNGNPVDQEGGLVLLADRAFVNYKGTEYEVDPTTFSFVKSSLEQGLQQGGDESTSPSACQDALSGLELGELFENVTSESDVDVDGTSTTKVSGDLKPAAAADVFTQVVEDPACKAQLEASGALPLNEIDSARGELKNSIKKAHADVYVGDDDIIRKLAADITIEPKGGAEGKTELEVELSLGDVNEEQQIKPPANAQPLEGLFQELGINPLELLESASSGKGLEGVLEGLAEGFSEGFEGSPGGSSSGGGSTPGTDAVECFEQARTPTDLQKCANLS